MNWHKVNNLNIGKKVWVVLAAILISRMVALLILENITILNDSGIAVKLGGTPAILDYAVYRTHIQTAWAAMSMPFSFFQLLQDDWREAWLWLSTQPLKPGPIFPYLLQLSNFEYSRYELSVVYFTCGGVLGWVWCNWIRLRGGEIWLQILVAITPSLVYYSFIVSTDLLYACVIAAWLTQSWRVLNGYNGAWKWSAVLMVTALMTRPNAISLLPLMFVLAWNQYRQIKIWLLWCLIWIVIGIYTLIYYLPYYWVHEGNAVVTHYWGILPSEYYLGLWMEWPSWLSLPLSWMLFVLVKVTHAVGFRPSYANMDSWLVILRAMPCILLLPGMFNWLINGSWFERFFLILFMLPIFVGASQERYLLAITPLLLFWGVRAWQSLGGRLRLLLVYKLE